MKVGNDTLVLMVIVAVPMSQAGQKNIYNSTSRKATLFWNMNPILVMGMTSLIV